MIKSPADITYGVKASKLDQRALDVLLERELFKRAIAVGRESTKIRLIGDLDEGVSFVDQVGYEVNREHYDLECVPRVVPFYTRAKEAVVHILIPEINKQELYVQVVESGNWTQVHILSNANSTIVISESIHADYTMAVSVAAAKALIRTPTELALKFSNMRRTIERLSKT